MTRRRHQFLSRRERKPKHAFLADHSCDVYERIGRQRQALRMNLNTLLRHEVLGNGKADREMVDYVASRLADADDIRRSRQFPYQFLAAYLNASAASVTPCSTWSPRT